MEEQEVPEIPRNRPFPPLSKKGKRQPRGVVSPLFRLASRRNSTKFMIAGSIANLNISLAQNSDVLTPWEKIEVQTAIRILKGIRDNFHDNWERIKPQLQAKLARDESQSQTTQSNSGPATTNSDSSQIQQENRPGESNDGGTSGSSGVPGGPEV